MDSWVVEVLRLGHLIPFQELHSLAEDLTFFNSYSPTSIKRVVLSQKMSLCWISKHSSWLLLLQGITAVCFLYRRSLGCDVQSSTFQCSIVRFRPLFFTWRLPPSVPKVLCQDNWMVSIDLKDAYLQIPIHPQSRKYFQFILNGKMHQFRVFCFSLTAAPQVYAQVMAPVLVFLHQIGCLDDWQILAPGYSVILLARDMTLVFCQELGICVNLEKFCLVPSLTNDLFGDDPFKHDFKGFSDACAGSESSSSIRGIIVPLCRGVFWVISFLCLGWFQGVFGCGRISCV